jgi:hypothetical protein
MLRALLAGGLFAGFVFAATATYLTVDEAAPLPGTERVACRAPSGPTASGVVGEPVVYGHQSVVAMQQRGSRRLVAKPLGQSVIVVNVDTGGTREIDLAGLPADTWSRKGFVYGYQDLETLAESELATSVPGWEGVSARYFHVAVGGIGPGAPLVVDLDGREVRAVHPGTLADLDRTRAARASTSWTMAAAGLAVSLLCVVGLVATARRR